MLGISGRERARMRRVISGREDEEDAQGEEEDGEWANGKKWSKFAPSRSTSLYDDRRDLIPF